jgi:MSHA biogenesis protein MshP
MKTSNHQQGFAAVSAIFLVVILAALGAFMVTFSNTQQLTSAQDLQGTRAYWAARAGLEFGIGSVVQNSVCPTSPSKLTVDNFTVCISCVGTPYIEGATTVNIFQFTSVARSFALASCNDLTPLTNVVGSIGYTERSISASMEK